MESIARNKVMVLSALSHKITKQFNLFCKTELMDRFLYACIDYFSVFFDLQKHLSDASEEMAKAERLNLYSQGKTNSSSITQLEYAAAAMKADEESRGKMREVAAIYAAILVKYTNYSNTQERHFFETLYDFSARVLFTMNDRKRWHIIENELGRIFRSDHFNLSMRKNVQHAAKPIRCKELYGLKQKDEPLARAREESQKPKSSIHTAMHMRSPVISTLFPAPRDKILWTAILQDDGRLMSRPGAGIAARSLGDVLVGDVLPPGGAALLHASRTDGDTKTLDVLTSP